MKTYATTARREDNWWVVEVDGVGVTQGRSTSEAQRMAVDLVAVMTGAQVTDIALDLDFQLPT